MSILLRRQIPQWLSFIIFAVLVVTTLVRGLASMDALGLMFNHWSNIVQAISYGLGLVSLSIYHLPRIIRMENEPRFQWVFSLSTMFFILAFIVVGVFYGNASPEYQWWYDTWNAPISGAAPIVSGLFFLPATYRSFKLRNWDGASLMIPAILFMIYQTPMFSGTPVLSTVMIWMLAYVTNATFRAAIVIVSLGILYLSIRSILGYEKGFLLEGGA